LAAEVGAKVQGGEGVGVGGMEVDRVAVGFAVLEAVVALMMCSGIADLLNAMAAICSMAALGL
jgi:hypothetical protein